MKHKHADLIHAWADGAEIEYLAISKEWLPIQNPTWRDDFEYRIKPKPKTDFIFYGKAFFELGKSSGELYGFVNGLCETQNKIMANLKLTFDGETGKLKSAEVLK